MKKLLLITAVVLGFNSFTILSASSAAPSMDPTIESNMLNQIASMQYAPIDSKIKSFNALVIQAKNIGYISPAVQTSYYAAINKVYSDLMAATNKNITVLIRPFINLLNNSITCSILDPNQKVYVRSYVLQLNQQIQNLGRAASKQKGSAGQVGRLR